MKVVKVTNPLYVAAIGPLVKAYVDKVSTPNMEYHSLVAVLQATAQFGGDKVELWIALDDEEKPVGWAHWHVMDAPFPGTVYFSHVYSQIKGAMSFFLDEFLNFAAARHSPWVMFDGINEKMAKHFMKIASERGLVGDRTEHVRVLMKRKA